ncbi:hypothetical protein L596_004696 [Steinernema carpocapsae]|uniref:Uncharacterized protein n=1 Tax=Steinernema carpocapsae TaxID=34508 RepID=A0A4U8UWL4_STECR|nr:hypothetical protein L596_004696 [Steinernema carpocapsae]
MRSTVHCTSYLERSTFGETLAKRFISRTWAEDAVHPRCKRSSATFYSFSHFPVILATAQDISDVLQFIRVPSVAPFCSGALVEAVTTNLEAVIRLLDKYSTYLERCNELGYDIPI